MAENDVTRSLLLGLLALREGLVDAPTLLSAFDAWCIDRFRTLGQILRDRGALPTEDCDRLVTSVEQHVLFQRNDHRSPATPVGPALEAVEEPRRSGQTDVAETVAYSAPESDLIGPLDDSGKGGTVPRQRCCLPDSRISSPMPRGAWGESTGPSIGNWDVRSR